MALSWLAPFWSWFLPHLTEALMQSLQISITRLRSEITRLKVAEKVRVQYFVWLGVQIL